MYPARITSPYTFGGAIIVPKSEVDFAARGKL